MPSTNHTSRTKALLVLLALLAFIKYGPLAYFESSAPFCVSPYIPQHRVRDIYSIARQNRNLLKASFLLNPAMVERYFSDQIARVTKNFTTPNEVILGIHAVMIAHGGVAANGMRNGEIYTYVDSGGLGIVYNINPWLFLFVSPTLESQLRVEIPTQTHSAITHPSGLRHVLTKEGLVIHFNAFTLLAPNLDFIFLGGSIAEYPFFQNVSQKIASCPRSIQEGSFESNIINAWRSTR